ncbi:MAG: hypothetical protein GY797_13730 [Deltaproteobacteria bacterium]|nr:hypothetical protein [Deltaproteobacteria bacterium]
MSSKLKICVSLWGRFFLISTFPIILAVVFFHSLSSVSFAQTSDDVNVYIYLPLVVKSSPFPSTEPPPFPVVPTMTVRISNTIAFIVDEGHHSLWIANVDGTGEKKILDEVSESLSSGDEWKNRVVWSPDGQRLAVNRYGGLWILSPDGDNLTEVVPVNWAEGKDITNLAWSPDGDKIAFLQRTEINTYYLGIVNVASGDINYITKNPRLEHRLLWSPDSKWIALSDHDMLSVTNVNSQTITSLGYGCQGGYIVMFSWSPQSDRLAVQDVGNGRYSHGESCVMTLDGQKFPLNVEGSSGKPAWTSDGNNLYVSATNFDPDNPDLEKDPRMLFFDKTGQFIKRLNITAEVGELAEFSPNKQHFLSWIANEQNWFTGYIQVACLNEAQPCSKKTKVNMIGRLFNADDLNALYVWAMDSRNAFFLSVTDMIYTFDLRYGSIYAFDEQSGRLKRVTNDHKIKNVAVSPLIGPTDPLIP